MTPQMLSPQETTVDQIYDQTVKSLPPAERLRLATLILNNIPPQSVIDYDPDWSEEDKRALTNYSLTYAASIYPEEEELV